jgi:hypothetical protein
MPAFAADFFGPKNSGTIYGVMFTFNHPFLDKP